MKKYSAKRLEAFIYYHFGTDLEYKVCDFHREMIGLLRYKRVAIAAPRGHAKSTYCSYFYPLYELLENPGVKILLVSATGTLAEHWLVKIRDVLETSDSLKEFYGEQLGGKWTNEEIHLANGSVLMAKGAGRQIRGFRPDIIIGDDLETDEMVVSKEQRDKFDNWFWATLTGTLKGNQGQVIVVGTILHPDSFLSDLIRQPRVGWHAKLYKALKEDGESLWPDMWPKTVLLERKAEMGDYAFAQEYMNDPVPDEHRVFQRDWFCYFDEIPQGLVYYTAVDLAISMDKKSDYTAIVTVGVDSDENIYVVDIENRHMLPAETIDKIFQTYDKWGSEVIGIEEVGFQRILKQEIERQRGIRKKYPRIQGLMTGGRRKSMRIEALQPRYQSNRVFHLKSLHELEELETQLLRFPSPRCHDDVIDALAYLLDFIRPAKKSKKVLNPNSMMARCLADVSSSLQHDVWGNHKLARYR